MSRFVAILALLVVLAAGDSSAAPLPGTGQVTLTDKAFNCDNYTQPLNLDLLKVTLTSSYTGVVDDAVNLNRSDCTGQIRRIEVDTSIGDGVKIGSTAHDLTIQGGYIYCHARKDQKHQDGIQALGGTHVHFQNLSTYCPTSNNASFFVSGTGSTPADVTCENCNLDGGAQTVSIAQSVDSGVFDSLVHTGKFTDHRFQPEAVNPVYRNNVVVP